MKAIVGGGGSDFEPAPAGLHLARLYRIVDLGTTASDRYTDEKTGKPKVQHQVHFTWELPEDLMSDGRPFVASRRYTLSLHERSNLRKDLESWRGKGLDDGAELDFASLLGSWCQLNIVHSSYEGKTFAKVTSVLPPPKGERPPIVNDPIMFDLDNFDAKVFEALPDWMTDRIKVSEEYRKMNGQTMPVPADLDDDLPDIPWN